MNTPIPFRPRERLVQCVAGWLVQLLCKRENEEQLAPMLFTTRIFFCIQVELNGDLKGGVARTVLFSSSSLDIAKYRLYLTVPESISFPTKDGETAYAIYYPPANGDFTGPAGEKPPLLVKSHGERLRHMLPSADHIQSFYKRSAPAGQQGRTPKVVSIATFHVVARKFVA
jgi:hypothetical protein